MVWGDGTYYYIGMAVCRVLKAVCQTEQKIISEFIVINNNKGLSSIAMALDNWRNGRENNRKRAGKKD